MPSNLRELQNCIQRECDNLEKEIIQRTFDGILSLPRKHQIHFFTAIQEYGCFYLDDEKSFSSINKKTAVLLEANIVSTVVSSPSSSGNMSSCNMSSWIDGKFSVNNLIKKKGRNIFQIN